MKFPFLQTIVKLLYNFLWFPGKIHWFKFETGNYLEKKIYTLTINTAKTVEIVELINKSNHKLPENPKILIVPFLTFKLNFKLHPSKKMRQNYS